MWLPSPTETFLRRCPVQTVEVGKRITLKNVLFATDFSPCSNAALPYALSVASQFGATLHATHVMPTIAEMVLMSPDGWPTMAEEAKIDLLVLGTHGRSGVRKLILGSVAEEVFRRAACPVLSVGPNVSCKAKGEIQFQQILFATDLS